MTSSHPGIVTTPIAVSVHRAGDNPLFGESAIRVALDDEAGGPFLVLSNTDPSADGGTRVDLCELEAVLVAARQLVAGYPTEEE